MTDHETVSLGQAIPMIVGMLNGYGGTPCVCLTQNAPPKAHCWLKERCCLRIRPDPMRYIECVPAKDADLCEVIVNVGLAVDKPYYDAYEGMEQGTWLWESGELALASRNEIYQMIGRQDGWEYESQRSIRQALTLEQGQRLFANDHCPLANPSKPSWAFLGSHGLWTNLAWILSDQRSYTIDWIWIEGWQTVGKILKRKIITESQMSLTDWLMEHLDELNEACIQIYGIARRENHIFPGNR